MMPTFRQITGAAMCALLVSCASGRSTPYAMRVRVADDANARTPVPVDVVFAWDKAIARQLAATNARDWFATRKSEMQQDDPAAQQLTVCQWEWVPGQVVTPIRLRVPVSTRRWNHGVFLFADYRTPGAHRSRLQPGRETLVDLQRDGLALQTTGQAAPGPFQLLAEACPAVTPPAASSPAGPGPR